MKLFRIASFLNMSAPRSSSEANFWF